MARLPPIPTPWSEQFRRIRYQLIPVLVFGVAIVLAMWLWGRQAGAPNAVGEVEVVRFEMTSPLAGTLVPLPGGSWQVFDTVKRQAVVARLDTKQVEASLKAVRAEVRGLNADLALARARAYQELAASSRDDADEERRSRAEVRRLALDVEQLRLDILDRKALIETDGIEWERQGERYKATKEAYENGAETSYTLSEIKLRRDVAAQRIQSNRKALAEAERQLAIVLARRDAAAKELRRLSPTPTNQPENVQILLDPFRARIDAQKALVEQFQLQIESLAVRSPITGTICEIYCRPGQAVVAGQPILAIAVDQSRHVISYVREYQAVRPRKGMTVNVRTRSIPRRTLKGQVEQVGPQVALVPPHHLRDPQVQEWGLPVRIAVPEVSSLPPGELVDISFELGP